LEYPTLAAKSASRIGHPIETTGTVGPEMIFIVTDWALGFPGLKTETRGTRHPAALAELTGQRRGNRNGKTGENFI
jgi:hypothetical protein